MDQAALLLEGETHGRRDYVYIYEGFALRSVVIQKFKMHLPAPGAPVFDLNRDPREENPLVEVALWSGANFQDMMKRHKMTMKKYPNSPIGTDIPYGSIDNLRPETKATVENFMSWHYPDGFSFKDYLMTVFCCSSKEKGEFK